MGRLRIAFPYLLFAAMAAMVVWSNVGGAGAMHAPSGSAATAAGSDFEAREVDPVCRMEVNRAWGISHTFDGKTFHFCVERCRKMFAADPEAYIGERCMVCNIPTDAATGLPATYLGRTFHLCTEDHRRSFKADPAAFFMHRMWGIPDWLYYLSIALVLIVSFAMFEGLSALRRTRRDRTSASAQEPARTSTSGSLSSWWGRLPLPQSLASMDTGARGAATAGAIALPVLPHGSHAATQARPAPAGPTNRVDLLQLRPVRALLLSRPFRFGVQLTIVLTFLVIVAAGLFGNQNPALNIAPILTWTIWWCGLVVLIMFAGKAWCYMCPWEAIAFWAERLRFWKKSDTGTGLGLRWPRVLRNIWLATILFVGLTWIELGFGITMQPRATAYIAIAMLVLAIVSAFLFDRKSFCRYGCLVGRVSGLYALFSGIEVRHKHDQVCTSCRTKECVRGSETAYGCPTFEYPGKMSTNTYCIQCAECLQACPHDNLAVNLRPWGADLAVAGKPRSDEAYLALLMLAITGFHGLTMTPVWKTLTESLESLIPIGRIAAFSVGMSVLMILPIVAYALLVWWSRAIAVRTDAGTAGRVPYREYFIRYAYCLLPIALFYHLAHNLEHLLMEGPKVVALASDPFGWGWNVLGTAAWRIPPLVSLDVLWVLQVILVGVGHVYSLWAAQKISRRLFTSDAAASRGQLPMLVGMILFSVLSLWLLKQPMEMRTSAM